MADRLLPVTLYGTPIGELGEGRGGSALFEWSGEAEGRWGLNSPILSRRLRVGSSDEAATESFFGALLPEGVHLERLARDMKVASSDLVGLLTRVGADLAGALRVGHRATQDPETLTPEQIGELLASASGYLVGGGGSALPGFQRKLTLTREDGRWMRGNGVVASTHILKPVDPESRAAIENEHFTLQIASRLGLAPYETWVEEVGGRSVLVIERYDRLRAGGGVVERIHQEDAGQALGLPWGGNDKFEQNNPAANLRAVAALLDGSRSIFRRETPDTERLLRYTVLNVAAGNTDAHAKNLSLLHDDRGGTRLAPFYDASSLALAYGAGTALSMSINGVSQLPDITRDDLIAEAVSWGLPAGRARVVVDETLDAIVEATRVIEAHASIEAHVPGYIRGQAQNLAEGRPARIPSVIPLMAQKRLGTPQPRDPGRLNNDAE